MLLLYLGSVELAAESYSGKVTLTLGVAGSILGGDVFSRIIIACKNWKKVILSTLTSFANLTRLVTALSPLF